MILIEIWHTLHFWYSQDLRLLEKTILTLNQPKMNFKEIFLTTCFFNFLAASKFLVDIGENEADSGSDYSMIGTGKFVGGIYLCIS